tara:strand:- start:71272 stop:73302 length:2031 start_codon:yes stop_codon:yes gene_type:complete
MQDNALISILIAALVALAIAVFFYGYKSKLNTKLRWFFGSLRFLTIFCIMLLLLNPKFTSTIYNTIKPSLSILIDNSQSVNYLDKEKETREFVEFLKENEELNTKFNLQFYSFGENLTTTDSLSFHEKQTNISAPLASLDEINKNTTAPVLLVSDGNQTLGTDYEFTAQNLKQPVYPVVLGDTITYKDLYINRINVNRYAYLKNEFPVEVFLVYNGDMEEQSSFVVRQGESVVYRQTVAFSPQENSKVLNFTLPANRVGVQLYSAEIEAVSNEKNTENNKKQFAVEVIDQATSILLVSDIVHPDLGAIKKAVTSNEQRRLVIESSQQAVNMLDDFQLIILYQPNAGFEPVMNKLNENRQNILYITGTQTQWNYLNQKQSFFSKSAYSNEEVQASLNSGYALFSIEDIGFNDFPPLRTTLGDLEFKVPHQVLLQQNILNITTESPLLSTFEQDNRRMGMLDGEGIWKWRANNFVRNNGFEKFDEFVGSLVQYLASNKRKSRLEVEARSFYYNSDEVSIKAQAFDKNYVFNNRASLTITVKNKETEARETFPLLLKNNFYEVNLSSLEAGEYDYTVSVSNEVLSASGSFTIIDFNVEQQFLNANVAKLERISIATGGKTFFIDNFEDIVTNFTTDNRYIPIQKSEQKVVPLIDWKYLLFLIVMLLAVEWFSRKYNGLI